MKSFKTFILEIADTIDYDENPNPHRKHLDNHSAHEHLGTTSKGHRVYADANNGDGQLQYHILKKGANRATTHMVSDHDRKITHKDLSIKHKSTDRHYHQMHGHDKDIRTIVAKDHNKVYN